MARFIKNADGTVTDNKLGLIWSPTLMDGKDRPQDEARAAIEALGEGWRFPVTDELLSLVDRSRYSPAIDTEFFPDTNNDIYWTDEPAAWNPDYVWVVDFYDGEAYDFPRGCNACVRAVRSVPSGQ